MKHKNDEHHDEFDMTGITEADIEKMVKDKYIPYDHSIDKKDLKSKKQTILESASSISRRGGACPHH